MFGKIKETKIEKPMLLRSYQAVFKTIDGEEHIGIRYNYVDENQVRRSVPQLLMIDIKNDGYLLDTDLKMYPLSNIISIEWIIADEKIKQYQREYEWQMYFDENEVEQMQDYKE